MATRAKRNAPTLGFYAQFVIRYRTLLAMAITVGVAGGLGLHFSTHERYVSTAHMVIVATTVGEANEAQEDVSMDSALQLLRSDQVIGQVAREIDYPGGPASLNDDVTTRPVINSRILRLSVSALDSTTALHAATAITTRFFEVRKDALVFTASAQIASVDAELAVVESELEARYRLATEESLLAPDESIEGRESTDTTGIRSLVTRRAQLHGERAFLDLSAPNPGYLSRPPTEAIHGHRTGLAITVASITTLSLLTAVGFGALHQIIPERVDRGLHRPPHLARRIR